MYTSKERNKRLQQAKRTIIPNLLINMAVPWLLYVLLRPHFANDTVPLAISLIIPAVKTLVQWAWQRKVDGIGIVSLIALALALIISVLSGGNSLPIKLVHPAIFCLAGLASIISVLAGKPLLLVIFKTIGYRNGEHVRNPVVRRKLAVMTTMIGCIAFIGSLAHIVMALVLSTGSYLAMSHVVSAATIVALVICAKNIVPRIK